MYYNTTSGTGYVEAISAIFRYKKIKISNYCYEAEGMTLFTLLCSYLVLK